ncbi:MAG: type IV pilin, partial [Thermoplasmata archaeon]
VIATILMVAITVVLASAVYIIVSGYMGSSPSKPVAMSFTVTSTSAYTQFQVISGNITVTASSPLIITVSNATKTVTFTLTAVDNSGVTSSGTGVALHIISVTGKTYLSGGDILQFTTGTKATGTTQGSFPLYTGTTVTFTYQGTVFYKYTL